MSTRTVILRALALLALAAAGLCLVAAAAATVNRPSVATRPGPPPTPRQYVVDVAGGARTDDVVMVLVGQTHLTREALEAALADPGKLGLPADANGQVEGYLASGSYTITATQDASAVLKAMVDRQQAAIAEAGLPGAAAGRHMSTHQLLTVASIAAAEGIPDDYAKVTRVVFNRLAKGMPLQMDSTVNYANGTRTLRLTKTDLDTRSAYNTYRRKGLPPGPIGNPGPRALAAAARPAAGPWLYFVLADHDGRSYFTDDYGQFLKQAEKSRRTGVY